MDKIITERLSKLGGFFKMSYENLSRFQCSLCLKWWSIGDAPNRDYWYCPWCGEKLMSEKNNELIDEISKHGYATTILDC